MPVRVKAAVEIACWVAATASYWWWLEVDPTFYPWYHPYSLLGIAFTWIAISKVKRHWREFWGEA